MVRVKFMKTIKSRASAYGIIPVNAAGQKLGKIFGTLFSKARSSAQILLATRGGHSKLSSGGAGRAGAMRSTPLFGIY